MRLNQISKNGKTVRCDYDSVEELAAHGEQYIKDRYQHGMRTTLDNPRYYGDCRTPGQAYVLAREGWADKLEETLEIAREAVESNEKMTGSEQFQPTWNVSGSMVDMGAFLAGEPECMIEFPPAKTTKVGRVITLCGSISVSGSVNASTLIKRGQVITALALELSRLGMNVELYADFTSHDTDYQTNERLTHEARILVKGPNDTLDPAKILFAYAHPAMLRVIALTSMHGLPDKFRTTLGVGYGYGLPGPPSQDLPEGTIYLPETLTGYDIPAADILREYMRDLGLTDDTESEETTA